MYPGLLGKFPHFIAIQKDLSLPNFPGVNRNKMLLSTTYVNCNGVSERLILEIKNMLKALHSGFIFSSKSSQRVVKNMGVILLDNYSTLSSFIHHISTVNAAPECVYFT